MPAWGNARSTNAIVAAAPVNAAETVVATLVAPATGIGQGTVTLSGQVSATTGATATGVTLRVRRGSLAGAVVGQPVADSIFAPAAAAAESHEINVTDIPGETAGQVYVLTYQCIGGTSNSAVTSVSLAASLSA